MEEHKNGKRFTLTERSKILADIQEAMDKGIKLQEACKLSGVSSNSYYVWKRQGERKRFHKVKRHAKSVREVNTAPKRSSNLVLEIIRDQRLADTQKAKMIEAYFAV